MKRVLHWLRVVGPAAMLIVGCMNVEAQPPAAGTERYPSKPIRWIVPFPPGGPTDLVARIVGQRLSERLKQPVVVENRPGAFGVIGMEAVTRAAPDGYTIYLGTSNEVINPILRKLSIDPLSELAPVSQLATTTFVLLANPNFPPRTLLEVLAAARSRPGAVTCGWGAAVQQLACEQLKAQGRVEISVVPYKGAAPALNDLIGGQINLVLSAAATALPQVRANHVAAIATANANRGNGPFGYLPTVGETLPGFEFESWFGVLAPSATPRDIVIRLDQEFGAVLEQDEVRKRLTDGGLEIAHRAPDAFAEFMHKDYEKYSKLIREIGIKAD